MKRHLATRRSPSNLPTWRSRPPHYSPAWLEVFAFNDGRFDRRIDDDKIFDAARRPRLPLASRR